MHDEEDGDGVEQDEEEVDIEIISSTLADQQIGKGVRRSTRLQQSIEISN